MTLEITERPESALATWKRTGGACKQLMPVTFNVIFCTTSRYNYICTVKLENPRGFDALRFTAQACPALWFWKDQHHCCNDIFQPHSNLVSVRRTWIPGTLTAGRCWSRSPADKHMSATAHYRIPSALGNITMTIYTASRGNASLKPVLFSHQSPRYNRHCAVFSAINICLVNWTLQPKFLIVHQCPFASGCEPSTAWQLQQRLFSPWLSEGENLWLHCAAWFASRTRFLQQSEILSPTTRIQPTNIAYMAESVGYTPTDGTGMYMVIQDFTSWPLHSLQFGSHPGESA